MPERPGTGTAPSAGETLRTRDGLTLHVEPFPTAGPPIAVCVFIHGFSAYCEPYRPLAAALTRAGVAATLFDVRGHGRSEGRHGYVQRFSDYLDDLALIVAHARAAAPPNTPLALVGHSHGALIALDYLGSPGCAVDALVLATPFLALQIPVPRAKLVLGRLLNRVWPTLALDNEVRGPHVSRTPEVVATFDTNPHIHHVATPRWYSAATAAQARVIAAAPRLEVPTLLLIAGEDRIASSEASRSFAQAAGDRVEIKRYDGLFHEVFLEPERDQVIDDVVRWIVARAERARILGVSP